MITEIPGVKPYLIFFEKKIYQMRFGQVIENGLKHISRPKVEDIFFENVQFFSEFGKKGPRAHFAI